MTDRRSGPALAVLVDGTPMEPEAARALWSRFSAWMEEHRGDLAGFAASEGYVSIHPGVDAGRPTLLVSSSVVQGAYAPARAFVRKLSNRPGASLNADRAGTSPQTGPKRLGGGSPTRHGKGYAPQVRGRDRDASSGKPQK